MPAIAIHAALAACVFDAMGAVLKPHSRCARSLSEKWWIVVSRWRAICVMSSSVHCNFSLARQRRTWVTYAAQLVTILEARQCTIQDSMITPELDVSN